METLRKIPTIIIKKLLKISTSNKKEDDGDVNDNEGGRVEKAQRK